MRERTEAYLLPDNLRVVIKGTLDENLRVRVGNTTHWANYVNHCGSLVEYKPLLPGAIYELVHKVSLTVSEEKEIVA